MRWGVLRTSTTTTGGCIPQGVGGWERKDGCGKLGGAPKEKNARLYKFYHERKGARIPKADVRRKLSKWVKKPLRPERLSTSSRDGGAGGKKKQQTKKIFQSALWKGG